MSQVAITCLGMNHSTASIELRGRLSESIHEDMQNFISKQWRDWNLLHGKPRSAGLAIISTCNRFELYSDCQQKPEEYRASLIEFLASLSGIEPSELAEHSYYLSRWDAILHLHKVACGLDSLVLGESQILGQVTDAYMDAISNRTLSPALSAAFQSALRSGKRARSETDISTNPASISSVAVKLAQETTGAIINRHVVVVGAGEMGRLAVKALHARGVKRVSVVNRTYERAEHLAESHGYSAYSFGQLSSVLADADITICATTAPHTILDRATIQQVMDKRKDRRLVLLDLAAPSDIQPSVAEISGVDLLSIDDLRQSLDDALAVRQQQIPEVERIIDEEMSCLASEYRQMAVIPVIVELRQMAEEIRQKEFERTRRYLGEVDDQTLEHVQHLSKALVNQLLHHPTVRLKDKAKSDQATAYTAAIRDLFGLQDTMLQ